MSKPITLTLDVLGDAPVGGKAKGLARLVELSLRVPEAFVVVGATPGQLPDDLAARYAELGGKSVAVRSSALGEDSADAGFAGQYETILNVTVRGAPVSRGRVVGVARIVRSLEDAVALERDEILVAPITDVGWTPYFGLIAGLVTDIGSAVSHGAVVAREYGLPAVVNTRVGSRVFHTGDRVVLDGELGIVRLANHDE